MNRSQRQVAVRRGSFETLEKRLCLTSLVSLWTAQDTNAAPNMDDQVFTAKENSPVGTFIGTVAAADDDVSDTLEYSIVGISPFTVDSATGAISVADVAELDFETNPTITFTVSVTDGVSLATADVTVNLEDGLTFGEPTVWFKGEHDAHDHAGHNNAAIQGSVAYVPGVYGQAYSFDGSSALNILKRTEAFDEAANGGSVEGWIRTEAGFAGNGTILSNYSGRETWGMSIINGVIDYSARDGALNVGGSVGAILVNDGNWHHVAGVRDGNEFRVYVDGVLDAVSGSNPVSFMGFTNSYVRIGGSKTGPGHYTSSTANAAFLVGAIDEFSVYPYPLSADEISEIYNSVSGKPLPGPTFQYSAEDDTLDSAGVNHGAAQGNLQYVSSAEGSAFSFDGTAAVNVAKQNEVLDPNSGDFTIEAYVKLEPTESGEYSLVSNYAGLELWGLGVDDGIVSFDVRDANNIAVTAYSTSTIHDGQWHHVAGVKDDNNFYVVIDGVVDGYASGTTAPITLATNYVRIGAANTGPGHQTSATSNQAFLDGQMDEIRFYPYAVNSIGGSLNVPPVVVVQSLNVDENSSNGTTVGAVQASDPNPGDTLAYSIVGGSGATAFAVDSLTGEITVADSGQLDFETSPFFTLTASVTDDGTPALSDTATININLGDVNEAPVIDNQVFSIAENSADGTLVGSVVATDPDAAASLTYTISGGDGATAFAINSVTGEIVVADSSQIDFESLSSLHVLVTVEEDSTPGLSDQATITIAVENTNDGPNAADDLATVIEDADIVMQVLANDVDSDGDSLRITETSLPMHGSVIVNSDGTITYSPDDNFSGFDSFSYTVDDFRTELEVAGIVPGDFFGRVIAGSGDVLAVAATGDDDRAADGGAIYVFRRDVGVWVMEAKLTPSDLGTGDSFAMSLAVDGDTIVAGNSRANGESGSAYVFQFDGTSWLQQAKLVPNDLSAADQFGLSVAIDGDLIVVGSRLDDDVATDSGSAYVFRRTLGTWNRIAKLTAPDPDATDRFGVSVAIDGEFIAVGAQFGEGVTTDSGAVYIFSRVGPSWMFQQKLSAQNGASGDQFGRSIGLDGNRIAIGATLDDHGSASGSITIFEEQGGVWSRQSVLTAEPGSGALGVPVTLEGNVLLAGAPGTDIGGNNAGAGYAFLYDGSSWGEGIRLSAPDPADGNLMGDGSTITGDKLVVGSPFSDDGGVDSGEVLIFNPVPLSATATVNVEIEAVADRPTLSVTEAQGDQDTSIPLSIVTSLVDTDGSEELSIDIDAVPAGAILSAGTDNGDGSWTLASSDLNGLTITPSASNADDFVLTVTSTATEQSSGDRASLSVPLPVTVNPINVSTWEFNSGAGLTAVDSVGSNDGILLNGPSWTSGTVDGALDFDHADDYVEVPHSDSLVFGDKLTLETWVKFDAIDNTYNTVLNRVADNAPYYATFTIRRNRLGDQSKGWMGTLSSELVTTSGYSNVHSTFVLDPNQWYHVVISYDGSEQRMYIDGQFNAAVPNSGAVLFSDDPVWIGRLGHPSFPEPLNGSVDHLSISNTSIGDAEVQALYASYARVPVADPGGPYNVNEGSTIPLDGSGATDPNNNIVSYEWDFDYDASTFEVDATGVSPAYDSTGIDGPATANVALRVTDEDGHSSIATTTVSVENAQPIVVSTVDQSTGEGSPFSLVVATFTDPAVADLHSATIDWGDGTGPVPADEVTHHIAGVPGTVSGSYVYADDGQYTVTVTVTDDDGGIGADSFTATVANETPTVDAGDDRSTLVGETVDLQGTLPGDLIANGSFESPSISRQFIPNISSIPGWQVNTVDLVNFASNTGSQGVDLVGSPGVGYIQQTISTVPGEDYLLRFFLRSPGDVTGVDIADAVRIDWNGVQVALVDALAPNHVQHDFVLRATSTSSTIRFAGVNYLGNWSGPILDDVSVHQIDDTKSVGFIDLGTADTHTATINWGDGSPIEQADVSESPFGPPGSSAGANGLVLGTHTYITPGAYQVVVSVTDDEGATSSDSFLVTVDPTNTAPVIDDQTFSVDENSPNGALVGTVSATDLDPSDVLSYVITAGTGQAIFDLDATSGELTVVDELALDFETTQSFTLYVEVTDSGSPALSDSAIVTVSVNDVNEAPVSNAGGPYELSAGTSIVLDGSSSTDPDGNVTAYEWDFDYDGVTFDIDGTGPMPILGATVSSPSNVTIALRVVDSLGLSAIATAEVAVLPSLDPDLVLFPIDGEFLVNTTTSNRQRTPSMAMDAFGNFVITWDQFTSPNGSVYAQRYDAHAQPIGSQFRVSNPASLSRTRASIAMADDGDYLIAYQGSNADGNSWGILARRYASDGSAIGGEFLVNSSTVGGQVQVDTAMASDGSAFVVAWEDTNDGSGRGVYAKLYDQSGSVIRSDFRVNTYTSGDQGNSNVKMLSDGSFIVVWESAGQDGAGYGIYGRRFGSDGAPIDAAEFRVNATTIGDQRVADLAVDDNEFVVAWYGPATDGLDIVAQRFDLNAQPIGNEFVVNTVTVDDQDSPGVSYTPDGDIVLVWTSNGQDGSGLGVFGRVWSPPTNEIGPEFQINTTTAGDQSTWGGRGTVVSGPNGSIVIAFEGNGPGDGDGVFARLYSTDIVVDPGGPYEVDEGSTIPLDASASLGSGILTYEWDLDYDGVTFDVDVSGATAPFTAVDGPATYDIALRVTDSASNQNVGATTVTVNNVEPTIALSGGASVVEGNPYTLTLGDVTDPGDDTVTQYIVNWGDGTTDTYSAPGDVTHTYSDGFTVPGNATSTITIDTHEDTFITDWWQHATWHPNSSHPDATNFWSINRFNPGAGGSLAARPMFKFDLTAYSGATVTSDVTFRAHLVGPHNPDYYHGTARSVDLYGITSPWEDETVTYNTHPSLQLIQRQSVSYTSSADDRYVEWTIPQATAQGWIDNPSSNHGVMIVNELPDSFFYDLVFASLEHPDNVPAQLEITVESSTQICVDLVDEDALHTDAGCLDVEVENLPPTADAGGPYEVEVDQLIALDGSASSDPGNDIVSYEWDFDYDGTTFDVNANGVDPVFDATGVVPGNRTIALRVTDSSQLFDISTTTVTVDNLPLQIDPAGFVGSYFLNGGAPLTGPVTIDLPAGTHTLKVATSNPFSFTVDEFGNVATTNSGAAQTVANTLTFNTTTVNLEPGLFAGHHGPPLGGPNTFIPGPHAISLVANLQSYRLQVASSDGFRFDIDANGNVSTFNTVAVQASGSTLTYNTSTITLEPGAFEGHHGEPFGGPTSYTPGVHDVELVPNVQNYRLQIASSPGLRFDVDSSGNVSTASLVAATENGSALELNNATVCMNPGAFLGNHGEPWGGLTAYSTGEHDVVLVPAIQGYRMLVDGVTAGLFEVQSDGTPNPDEFVVNVGGQDYTITLDSGPCNTRPTADAGGPYEVEVGQSIILDGSGSSDPEDNIVSYEWDFDYDGVTFDVEAVGVSPSYATGFADETRTIALRVADAGGLTDIDSATLTIQALPVAAFDSIDGLFVEGSPVDVLASATHPTPSEVLVFAYEVLLDGATVATNSGVDLTSFSFTPSDNGQYEIVLTVTDEDGDTDVVFETITVDNVAPTATLNVVQVDDTLALPEVTAHLEGIVDTDSDSYRFSFGLSLGDLAEAYATANVSDEATFVLPIDSNLVIYGRVFDDDDGSNTYSLNTIVGTPGNDVISGNSSRQLIIGLGGQDTISAGSGADFVYAGAGADTVNGGRGADFIDLGVGNDTLQVLGSHGEFDVVIGGDGYDKVANTDPSNDLKFNEFLSTSGSLEELDAAGRSVLGNGQDNVFDFANAKLTSVAGVYAGGGADAVTASAFTHDVSYYGQRGDDVLTGLGKRDQLFGDDGNDIINAGGATDVVDGGKGMDTINLGDGNDTLQVNGRHAEFDQMTGGAGYDTVVNTDPTTDIKLNAFLSTTGGLEELDAAGVNILGNGQANTFDFATAKLTNVLGVYAGGEADTITASEVTHDIAYYGQNGSDTLIGGSKRDQLFGGAGADTISAGGSADTVDGGKGADDIDLGPGNDTLRVNNNWAEFDQMVGGTGNDVVVNVDSTKNLKFNEFLSTVGSIEELDAAGTSVVGNSQANVLDFANVKLTGVVDVSAGGGADSITASGVTHDVAYFGQGGDDTLVGLNKRDQLFGGRGDDVLLGGGAADLLVGGKGFNQISGQAGSDTIWISSRQETALIADFKDEGNDRIGFDEVIASILSLGWLTRDVDGDGSDDDLELSLNSGRLIQLLDTAFGELSESDFFSY